MLLQLVSGKRPGGAAFVAWRGGFTMTRAVVLPWAAMGIATARTMGMTMARAVSMPWPMATRGTGRGNSWLATAAYSKPHGVPCQPPGGMATHAL